MKLVLIRFNSFEGSHETNITGVYPPLGLAGLAAYLRTTGHEPIILDGDASGKGAEALLDEVPSDAKLLGVTSTTLSWPYARRGALAARRRFPELPLVIGGPHVTAFPELTMEHSPFDLGVLGDGEWALSEIAGYLDRAEPTTRIPGTAWRDRGAVIVDRHTHWMTELDDLPMPALDLVPPHNYRSVIVREPFVTMLASRGCPYHCHFCTQVYTGDRFRFHGPVRIVDEMERGERLYGAREIVLFDETFGTNRKDALEVCRIYRERGLTARWSARTRIDLLDRELLAEMRRSGCYRLHLGIESGVQHILDKMNKKITLERIREIVREAKALGYELNGYFMLGYPGESREEVLRSMAFSRELDLDWVSYTITIPNPLTPLADEAIELGLLPADFWTRHIAGQTDGRIPFLSSTECPESFLKKTKRDAYLRFYLRPHILRRQFSFVLSAGGIGGVAAAGYYWLRELL